LADERKIARPKTQNLVIENREKLSITGVIDVDSFNDECVVVDTELGILIIRGNDLHISKLNLENAELDIEGDIVSCEYDDKQSKSGGGGFFGKLFK